MGRRILEYYADSDVGRQIAKDLPAVTAKADRQAAEQRQKDDLAKKQLAAKAAASQKTAIAELKKQRDEVEKVSFYYAASTSREVANQWALYLGVPDGGKPYLRFKWMYAGDDWLFVKGLTLSVDGKKLGSVPINFYAVKRDNSGGQVWEWQDEGVEESNIPFFKMLADSKKTIIRYEGTKYYKDRTLSETEKKAFTQILTAFEAIRGK